MIVGVVFVVLLLLLSVVVAPPQAKTVKINVKESSDKILFNIANSPDGFYNQLNHSCVVGSKRTEPA